jgi:hypothetical protein
MATLPKVELLWCGGCPSVDGAIAALREALLEVGLGDVEVQLVEIRSDEEARASGFAGSPTILIDGGDLITLARGGDLPQDAGHWLRCRVYRRRDGQIAPTPDPQDITDALLRAISGPHLRRTA